MADGRFLRMVRQGRWEYVERHNTTGAVAVIAVTSGRQLVLVEQYRVPMGMSCIELPAGLAGDLDDPEEAFELAARRELHEETGFEADQMAYLYRVCTSPGLTSETIDLFRATGLTRTGPGGGHPDEGEEIIVHLVDLDAVEQWIVDRVAQGLCIDVKVYTAIALARQWDAG